MFLGEFFCKIDVKNRIFIPKVFRKISSEYIVTLIDSDTLVVNKYDGWSSSKVLKSLEINSEQMSRFTKYINSHSFYASLDSQGRIIIPSQFMKMISFKEAVVVGCEDSFSILNKEKYYKEMDDISKEFNDFLSTDEGLEFKQVLIYK